jgi:cleavage and polyadenylation specificity factor subunit 3
MFLEAQFGADNVNPIEEPRLPVSKQKLLTDGEGENDGDGDDVDNTLWRQAELARLHKMGIPVPGVAIKVDKMEATVWLEDLEVDCKNRVFADRVRAVVERAVEVVAPLWG